MTVSLTTLKNTYIADGIEDTYAFSFPILDEEHILVQVVNSTFTVQDQELGVEYTITGTGNTPERTNYTSGSIIFESAYIPEEDDIIVIRRNIPLEQETLYIENDPFPAKTHEEALDKLTMITQQLQEQIDRSYKSDFTSEDSSDFQFPTAIPNYYIRFNSDGTALEAVANTGTIGLDHVEDDPSPSLGGDLDVDGNKITSTFNGHVTIEPNGTGFINLNAADVFVEEDIIHQGDSNNKITFGTDTQTFTTGGSSRMDISDTGIRLGASNARVTTILNESTLVSNSATALPTQQAVKGYVDATAVLADGPIIRADLDTDGFSIVTNDSNENITLDPNGSGSIILVTDTGGTLQIDGPLVHRGDTDNNFTFGTDTQTFTTNGTSRMDITSAGVRLGTGSRVTTILDDDTFSANSDTSLATQQSIKAYVDSSISYASQAEQETGTAVNRVVSPGRQHFHPSACKVWVHFNGNSSAILASYNVTSITDLGATRYRVTIANDMSSTNYCILATGFEATGVVNMTVRTQAAGTYEIDETSLAGTPDAVYSACFGDI